MERTQISAAQPQQDAGAPGTPTEDPREGEHPSHGRKRPLIPSARPAADSSAETLGAIRRFHLGDARAADVLATPSPGWLPAPLFPFRSPRAVRQQYPLIVFLEGSTPRCLAIDDLLEQATASFAPGQDDARVLKDNLVRLELEIRAAVDALDAPHIPAAEVLARAAHHLILKLSLKGESGRALRGDLDRLLATAPQDALLLPMSCHAGVLLYLHAAVGAAQARRSSLRESANKLRGKIRDLLALERSKGAGGGSGLGAPALHIDTEALSRVLGTVRSRSEATGGRTQRLEKIVQILDRHLAASSEPCVHIVSRSDAPSGVAAAGLNWRATPGGPCAVAAELFDGVAAEHADLFAAIRAARLELADAYEPAIHDAMAAALDWRGFSREELLLLPPVLAVESPEELAGGAMLHLSRLLLSGRPVDVLVEVAAASDPGAGGADLLGRYRLELAYLGIGHREAMVNQSAAARPEHLLDGYVRGLASPCAALHVVMSPLNLQGEPPPLGAWLHGGAAVEGRGHPLFHYDPTAGETWARRLDFSLNPAPTEDWPAFELDCDLADGGETLLRGRFTFADFCLLEPAYRGEFRVIPDGFENAALIEAADYLALLPEDSLDKVPFVWATDAEGIVRRVCFTRRLAFACRDRLGYWHTLQELSGVRNEHVAEAVRRERERLETSFAEERARLQAERAEEIDEVRRAAAAEALRRLAGALVSSDLASLAPAPGRAPAARPPAQESPATAEASASPAEAPPAQTEEEEETGFDEPWVETALCTSCNDCTNINPRVFVYNANKQVVIGDPKAGTYAEIVAAAEKCPARCIHPGKPLNASEPGLDELVERAKPFN